MLAALDESASYIEEQAGTDRALATTGLRQGGGTPESKQIVGRKTAGPRNDR